MERENLRRIEIPNLERERASFRSQIIGQEESLDYFSKLLVKIKSGIRSSQPGPIASVFALGPSGVGKTKMVEVFAQLVGGPSAVGKIVRINGGEYSQEHQVARVLGSPPGYRGSEDSHDPNYKSPALLSENNIGSSRISYTDSAGKEKSIVIILVDEAEKAHRTIHDAFLAIMDKGQVVTGNNRVTDLSEAVIFYTSNTGNDQVEAQRQGAEIDSKEAESLYLESYRNTFRTEFRGRIDTFLIFNPLDEEGIKQITDQKMKLLEENFAQSNIRISLGLSTEAREWVTKKGFNRAEGARALEKVLVKEIFDKLILAHSTVGIDRRKIFIDVDGDDLAFYFTENEYLPDLPIEKKPSAPPPSPKRDGENPTDPAPEVKVTKVSDDPSDLRRRLWIFENDPRNPRKNPPPSGGGVMIVRQETQQTLQGKQSQYHTKSFIEDAITQQRESTERNLAEVKLSQDRNKKLREDAITQQKESTAKLIAKAEASRKAMLERFGLKPKEVKKDVKEEDSVYDTESLGPPLTHSFSETDEERLRRIRLIIKHQQRLRH